MNLIVSSKKIYIFLYVKVHIKSKLQYRLLLTFDNSSYTTLQMLSVPLSM